MWGEKGANKDTYYTCEVLQLILKNLHKEYFIYSPVRKTENHHSLPLEGVYIRIHVLIIQILDQLSLPA